MEKIKILLIVDDYVPHSIKIAAKMMHEMALRYKQMGYEVSVLTPDPLQKEPLIIKDIEGINVLYFKSGEIKNISKIKRAINETLLSWKAWQASKKYFRANHFDGIIYYSPSIFWGLLIKRLKMLWKCNSYLILRDIFPQWTLDNGLMSEKSPIYWYFKFFEWINYKFASKIGVMSPSNVDFFKNKNTNISKFEVLFNWAETPELQDIDDSFRKKLKLENKTVLFYGGNIGHSQKMINLIQLAKQFKDNPTIHFLFVGKGDEVELIQEEKKTHTLNNITYLPSVDQETYFKMLNEFDIGLFSLHPDHKTHNFPGKLLGYMAYSKPILGCVNPGNDLKEIVNQAKAGIVVESGNEKDLYDAAKSLIESENLRNEMGLNGRQLLAKQFSVESACLQIEKTFKQ